MKNPLGQFSVDHWELFSQVPEDQWNYVTCQRPDGSYYGTGGTCRKGTETKLPEKEKKTKKPAAKAPLDTGAMSAMSDSQLKALGKQKELDATQKTAISNELRARQQAAGDFDKSGMQARTETAQQKQEDFLIRKGGGYVTRKGDDMMKDPDGTYTDKGIYKQNIEYQKNVTQSVQNDKMAREMLLHANRLQDAGAVKNDYNIYWDGQGVGLEKMVKGVGVQLYNHEGTIGWKVGGGYSTMENLPSSTKRAIATETRKMFETMVKASSNNAPLNTSAWTGDGRGEERRKAYETMGFSKPFRGQTGNDQYAKVVFGNVIPITKAEWEQISFERNWRSDSGQTQYAERPEKRKLTDGIFYLALFGKP